MPRGREDVLHLFGLVLAAQMQQLGKADHGVQRGAHLVAHAGEKLARAAAQRFGGMLVAQRLVGVAQPGDVGLCAHHAQRTALIVTREHAAAIVDPQVVAIAMAQAVLDLVGGAAAAHMANDLGQHARTVAAMQQAAPGRRRQRQLALGVAQHRLQRRRRIHAQLAVPVPDAVAGPFEGVAPALVGSLQRTFGALAVADVDATDAPYCHRPGAGRPTGPNAPSSGISSGRRLRGALRQAPRHVLLFAPGGVRVVAAPRVVPDHRFPGVAIGRQAVPEAVVPAAIGHQDAAVGPADHHAGRHALQRLLQQLVRPARLLARLQLGGDVARRAAVAEEVSFGIEPRIAADRHRDGAGGRVTVQHQFANGSPRRAVGQIARIRRRVFIGAHAVDIHRARAHLGGGRTPGGRQNAVGHPDHSAFGVGFPQPVARCAAGVEQPLGLGACRRRLGASGEQYRRGLDEAMQCSRRRCRRGPCQHERQRPRVGCRRRGRAVHNDA